MDGRFLRKIATLCTALSLCIVANPADAASSLSAAPIEAYTGTAISFSAVAMTAASTGNYRIDFGDGGSAFFPATGTTAAYSTSHVYAAPAYYNAKLFDTFGNPLAQTFVRISPQFATLSLAPNPSLPGGAVNVTITVTTDPYAPAPGMMQLSFGDGATSLLPYASQTVNHAYSNAGTYGVQLRSAQGALLATGTQSVTAPAPLPTPTPTPTATPTPTPTATPTPTPLITPTPTVPVATSTPVVTPTPIAPAVTPTPVVPVATPTPTVTPSPKLPAATPTPSPTPTSRPTVVPTNVFLKSRTPVGQVFTTTLTLSPVLAGGSTSIVVRYALADRAFIVAANPVLAYVELLTPKGLLLRRSDPFEIPSTGSSGIQTAEIPYDVPVDAGGRYSLRLILRSANGGTIARSEPLPFLIAAGPDPKPRLKTDFRASGALELGSSSHGHGTFDPGLATALQFPAFAIGLTGLFDPVSRRSDPLLSLTPGGPGAIASPDTAPVASTGPAYKDTYGRTTAVLPDMLGGGTTLRGFDANRTAGLWTLHGAIGSTQSGTATLSPERAEIIDVTRAIGRATARATVFDRIDDGSLAPGALNAQSSILELNAPFLKYLTFAASGGTSTARSLVSPLTASDASTKGSVNYVHDSTAASFEYHNAGDGFAVGAGPGATSDRVGYLSTFAVHLAPKFALTVGSSRDDTRSTLQRQTDAFGTLAIQIGTQAQLQLGVRRDQQSSASARTLSDQLTMSFLTPTRDGTLSFNAAIVGLSDARTVANASATRTGTLQYLHQKNAHTVALGITGSASAGMSANAQVGESLTYGFPIGGKLVNGMLLHGFELQLAATNSVAAQTFGAPSRDSALSTILSYHVNSHIAVGVRSELHQRANNALGSSPPAAIRLRLDITQ